MTANPDSKPVPVKHPPPAAKPAGPRRVNMREVARLADVSVATVSMVLNNNSRISPSTQAKVRKVMEQVGYRPNRNAQSLSSQYTRLLAVLLPPLRHAFSDPYFGELISGISDRASRLGHKIILEQAKPDFLREKKHLDLFERRYVDGIFCMGINDRHTFVKDFVEGGHAAIVVNNSIDQVEIDHIVCDYRGGAEQVMQFLVQLGHKKIALVHGASSTKTTRDVIDVYRKRLAEVHGKDDGFAWMADGMFTEEGGAEAMEKLLAEHPDLTAVFATNDKMALGVMHTLSRRGIKVPDEVSVVGFDDLQTMAFVNPSLTTVHLPFYEVGGEACEALIDRIRGKRRGPIQKTLETRLVLRNSTGIARPDQRTL